jgi:hypothetical protein
MLLHHNILMMNTSQIYSQEERYKLISKLLEEIRLRGYSFQTGKSYLPVVRVFGSVEPN